jgi:hypothetical protein
VPLTIKATIRKLIEQSLYIVLTGKKERIPTFYKELYQVLFAERTENIESQIQSRVLKLFVELFFVLQPKIDCVKCILDQLIDLDSYAISATIDYISFQHKWNALEKSLTFEFSVISLIFEVSFVYPVSLTYIFTF